jgi:preprotein translocase subunit SecE
MASHTRSSAARGPARAGGHKKMKKITNRIAGIKTFFGEVRMELTKCSWPTRQELVESTVVVIVASAILGAYVGGSDLLLMQLLKVFVR